MNKKIFVFLFTLAFFAMSAVVLAASPDGNGPWADEVISFSQGLRENGTAVAVDRSNPNNALGVAEGTDAINFVALGYGGELVVKFENSIYNGDGNDLRVVETTYNNDDCASYPERVQVEVSADGVNWIAGGSGCQDFELDLTELNLECVQYVKMTDITNPDEFNVNHITDAYDVDGVMALNSREGDCLPPPPECTLTQGYWKNHTSESKHYDEAWSDYENEPFYLSGMNYSEVLHTSPKGNAYYQLAHQFIAATLNGLTADIYPVWLEADNLFDNKTPDDLEQPKGKKSEGYKILRQQFINLSEELAKYNEGLTGPGHCSDN